MRSGLSVVIRIDDLSQAKIHRLSKTAQQTSARGVMVFSLRCALEFVLCGGKLQAVSWFGHNLVHGEHLKRLVVILSVRRM